MADIIDIDTLTCWNPDCDDYLVKNNGNILIKEFKGKNQHALLICRSCGKCFSETRKTPFFKLKTNIDELARTLSLIPKLGSIRAVARYTNHKPDTIINWIELVRNNREEINDYFINHYQYNSTDIEEVWSTIETRKRIRTNKEP